MTFNPNDVYDNVKKEEEYFDTVILYKKHSGVSENTYEKKSFHKRDILDLVNYLFDHNEHYDMFVVDSKTDKSVFIPQHSDESIFWSVFTKHSHNEYVTLHTDRM